MHTRSHFIHHAPTGACERFLPRCAQCLLLCLCWLQAVAECRGALQWLRDTVYIDYPTLLQILFTCYIHGLHDLHWPFFWHALAVEFAWLQHILAFNTVYTDCGQRQLWLHVLSIANTLSTLVVSFPDNWNGQVCAA